MRKEIIMKEHSYIKKGLLGLLCAALLIFLDQLSKYAAVRYLQGQDALVLIDGVFELRYLENRGAAFGILQNQQIFFILSTSVVLILIAYIYLRKIPNERRFLWLNIMTILFFAGAVGNFIDRVVQNYVVDFFYFCLINFPIFNVADIYVTVAAFLLIILGIFYYKEEDFERIFPSRSSGKGKSTKK